MDGVCVNTNKAAIVTGGSHGIGRGIVKVLAENGYDIAFTYNKRREDADGVMAMVKGLNRRCFMHQASLDREEVPEAITQQMIEQLGRVDLLVANAGLTRHTSILNVTNEQITSLFNLNYRAYLLCAKAAARHMVKTGTKGSIIFITSSRGSRAYPEDMLYGGFKAGIERACESMALDLAPYKIRVNCVAPGMTMTGAIDEVSESYFDECIPLGRIGTPYEMGQAVAYLASGAANYITGITLRLDGGLILPGMPESLPENASWINHKWTERQRMMLEEEPK